MSLIEIASELDVVDATPVWLAVPPGEVFPRDYALQLREEGGSRVLRVQRDGDRLVTLLPETPAHETLRFRLERAPSGATSEVTLKEDGPHRLAIHLPEGLFTAYNFDPAIARPFFYPVLGPGGKMVTRNYPMKDVAGETKDHPHHRSFWTAYGEVNDVDDWSEMKNHGWIKHQKFENRSSGPVFAGFTSTSVWTSADGKPLLDERRGIRVYNVGPERRLLDYNVELKAAYQDIHYGDTKEGGILAFRVASTMDAKKDGRIENSNGGVGEKQVWGKRAAWLDYSGPVDGQIFGIAMMDHPGNFQHPCYWHARDYGLVGTNSFAKSAFEGGPKTGSNQKKGETLRFRYRVLIHRGGAAQGQVDDAYHAWIQGPSARIIA